MTRRRSGRRRGVALPLVCVLATALLGGAALAVDIGRLYLTAGEAQAAADAAATAGARFLQQYTVEHLGYITGSYGIGGVTPLNRVAGATAQVTGIQAAAYDPVANTVSASSWHGGTSALTVTVSATPKFVFAHALGLTPPAVSRKATAWIANLSGATCVRPFALPYTRNFEVGIVGHRTSDSTYTRRGALAPEYTYAGVASLQPIWGNTPPGRTYTSIPQWEQENVVQAYPNSPRADSGRVVVGRWLPVDFSGGGLPDYQTFLSATPRSPTCQAAATENGTNEAPLAGYSDGHPSAQVKQTILDAMAAGMARLCNRVGTNADAHCYDGDGSVGVRARVLIADSLPGGAGGFRINTREVSVVRIMCYFQSKSDVCAPAYIKDQNSTDAATTYWSLVDPNANNGHPLPTAYYGYPAGTISVLLDGPTNVDMTSDLTFGTKPAITQRVFLVR